MSRLQTVEEIEAAITRSKYTDDADDINGHRWNRYEYYSFLHAVSAVLRRRREPLSGTATMSVAQRIQQAIKNLLALFNRSTVRNVASYIKCLILGHDWVFKYRVNSKTGDPGWFCVRCERWH